MGIAWISSWERYLPHVFIALQPVASVAVKLALVRGFLKPRFYWQVIEWALCERPFKRQMVTERSLLKEAGGYRM